MIAHVIITTMFWGVLALSITAIVITLEGK
jgi:hypothetical protein